MTAVEWLFKTIWDCPKDKLTWYTILEQAKEMERLQLIDAKIHTANGHKIDFEDRLFSEDLY